MGTLPVPIGPGTVLPSWRRKSTVGRLPQDPVAEVVAATLSEMLRVASVELLSFPAGDPPPPEPHGWATASAVGDGPPGWKTMVTVKLVGRAAPTSEHDGSALLHLLSASATAAVRTAARFAADGAAAAGPERLSPALRRALRDTLVIEALTAHQHCVTDLEVAAELVGETVEFLIELSGTRVESQDLTHGVVITDALKDVPRLWVSYPRDLRAAKRGPLLFDGIRSVLLVDPEGRARTEVLRHRLDRLPAAPEPPAAEARRPSGRAPSRFDRGFLVAEASRRLGGLGFFLRADRTIWVFADGQPLMMRRGERWTAFPLELATFLANVIGTSAAGPLVVAAAFIVSATPGHGAILAIVEGPDGLDGVVPQKDRYDLRDDADPDAMRVETRLHHLIDANELDEEVLARLATLDGATIVDRDGRLLAYGAVVSSSDSQHEGARTAAARSLSRTAEVVLKVSADGDITVFQQGAVIATLLGSALEG